MSNENPRHKVDLNWPLDQIVNAIQTRLVSEGPVAQPTANEVPPTVDPVPHPSTNSSRQKTSPVMSSMYESNDITNASARTSFPSHDTVRSERRPEYLSLSASGNALLQDQNEVNVEMAPPIRPPGPEASLHPVPIQRTPPPPNPPNHPLPNDPRQHDSQPQKAPPPKPLVQPKAPKQKNHFGGGGTGNIGQFNLNTYDNSRVSFFAFGDSGDPRRMKRTRRNQEPEVVTISSDEDGEDNPPPCKRKPAGGDARRLDYPFHEKFGMDQKPRLVDFTIEPNKPYDIRNLIDSQLSTLSSGICDSNSFDEIMEEWAKTIVAGRARIGGIPIGIVSSQLRNVKNVAPADPAAPNSQSLEIHQQVWNPDSASKTAEVIGDFNREGLPLFFIVSLRVFSGEQKDMYDMVLKFGAQIVDALRQYKQSVIIYILEEGELRGGAWAVLDSTINPGLITMVADEEPRGGILEPNAIVGIKFRQDKMLALQIRNDELMKNWDKELSDEIRKNGPGTEEALRLSNLMKKRSAELMKVYRSVSVEFADLHDRAARMHRKGAVQHVTDLAHCRNLFIQIFSLENTKIHLAEKYKSVARDVTLNDSYKWVQDQLEAYNPGFTSLSPFEQAGVVEKYVSEGKFRENVNMVHEDSVERGILSMPPDVRNV